MLIFKREVSQHRAAKAQQARKIYCSSALKYNGSVLFKIDYIQWGVKVINIKKQL